MHFSQVSRRLETSHRLIQSSEKAPTNPCSLTRSLPPHFLVHSLTHLSSSFLCSASCWFLINHVTLFWAFKCLRANLEQLLKDWTLRKSESEREKEREKVKQCCVFSVVMGGGVVLFQSYLCWPRLIPEASDKALNIWSVLLQCTSETKADRWRDAH